MDYCWTNLLEQKIIMQLFVPLRFNNLTVNSSTFVPIFLTQKKIIAKYFENMNWNNISYPILCRFWRWFRICKRLLDPTFAGWTVRHCTVRTVPVWYIYDQFGIAAACVPCGYGLEQYNVSYLMQFLALISNMQTSFWADLCRMEKNLECSLAVL